MYYPYNHPNSCKVNKSTGRFVESIIIESELLWSLYWGNQYSMEKIGNIFNCGHVAILKKMKKFNIPRRSLSQAAKICTTNGGRWENGKEHPDWKGGISFEPYGIEFNEKLKRKIRELDNYTCQECEYTEDELGYILSCHHIDYDKQNNSEDNLISLCRNCHSKTNMDRNDWTKYFKSKLQSHNRYVE